MTMNNSRRCVPFPCAEVVNIHTYVCIRVSIHIGHINDSFIQLFILAFIHLHGKLVSLFGVSFTLAQTPF